MKRLILGSNNYAKAIPQSFIERAAYTHIAQLAWPGERLGEAIEALAHSAGLTSPGRSTVAERPAGTQSLSAALVESIADQLGIEAEPIDFSYTDLELLARSVAPAIVQLPAPHDIGGVPRFLAIVRTGRWWARVIGPDMVTRRLRAPVLRSALGHTVELTWDTTTGPLLARANLPPYAQRQVRRAMLAEQQRGARIGVGWILRRAPGASLWSQLVAVHSIGLLAGIVGLDLAGQLIGLISWQIIGSAFLRGQADQIWLSVWVLLLLTSIPLAGLSQLWAGRFAAHTGALLKDRLLYGTLQLEPDEIRHQGHGQFLGQVMEANSLDILGMSGSLLAIMSITRLLIAVGLLAIGAGGWLHSALLVVWIVLAGGLAWWYARRYRRWVAHYRQMTNDLVQQMVGHTTRLAQEAPARWHRREDRDLDAYVQLSRAVDRAAWAINLLPRSWMLVGLAAGVALMSSQASTPIGVLIGLGGVLFGLQGFTNLVNGITLLATLLGSWEQVAPLSQAAARAAARPSPLPPAEPSADQPAAQPLLVMRDLSFRYQQPGGYALRECSLTIRPGDRLLLGGRSGGGKSTLSAVLAGLRVPEQGLLLLNGYDRQTVGQRRWRRQVTLAPQFHENYVFCDTFAFNMLMGRRWPPLPEDEALALALCRELGLDELIGRMPAGLYQMVGEHGWQLSHGERSRLYIARALAQEPDVIILDESFAALDPENLRLALTSVRRRATTLLVIAHP